MDCNQDWSWLDETEEEAEGIETDTENDSELISEYYDPLLSSSAEGEKDAFSEEV